MAMRVDTHFQSQYYGVGGEVTAVDVYPHAEVPREKLVSESARRWCENRDARGSQSCLQMYPANVPLSTVSTGASLGRVTESKVR